MHTICILKIKNKKTPKPMESFLWNPKQSEPFSNKGFKKNFHSRERFFALSTNLKSTLTAGLLCTVCLWVNNTFIIFKPFQMFTTWEALELWGISDNLSDTRHNEKADFRLVWALNQNSRTRECQSSPGRSKRRNCYI